MYKLTTNPDLILLLPSTFIPRGNTQWLDYEDWLAAGNAPEPADPLPMPVIPDWTGFNTAFISDSNWLAIAAFAVGQAGASRK